MSYESWLPLVNPATASEDQDYECQIKVTVNNISERKHHRLPVHYITLPQTHQGKRPVLTMVEATTVWLETYPVPHATARNTILGLEKQILW